MRLNSGALFRSPISVLYKELFCWKGTAPKIFRTIVILPRTGWSRGIKSYARYNRHYFAGVVSVLCHLSSPRLQLHHCLQASSHSHNFLVLTWCSTEYVGCYKDSDPRDLPQRLHDREVTVSSCVKNCKDLFYRYAGIQFSYLCFCGNKRGRYGQLPEWKCSSECASKKDEHCGGYWSNSIYKTGYDPPGGVKITPLLKAALNDLKPRANATKHKGHKTLKKDH